MKNRMRKFTCIFLFSVLLLTALLSCSPANKQGSRLVVGKTATRSATVVVPTAPAGCASKSSGQITASITVAVDFSCSIGTSQFAPGISIADTGLNYPWDNNNFTAVNNAKFLITHGIVYENTSIMGWGLPDPWPDPNTPNPTDWSALDQRMQVILQTGGTPVLTLTEAPWWMKGQLQSNGTTKVLTAADEWADISYGSRILDNKMGDWLHLVQRVAERYMAPPYNVRYFQVWNELKGYSNPVTNTYDYTTSPGDPSGPNAKHGYTYMYNQVYQTLMNVAHSMNVATTRVKVGGPYVFIDTWGSKDQSNPSNIVKNYGVYDQRSLDVIAYWLRHKTGAGFLTFDTSIENRGSGDVVPQPFSAASKFADTVLWIRSLDPTLYPDAATLPIWLAEWFASPHTAASSAAYDNAVKSDAMIKFLEVGGATALSWNNTGDGDTDKGLWTGTASVYGGRPLPWYFTYQALRNSFAPGTKIYNTIVSAPDSIDALASATTLILVNKTPNAVTASVNGKNILLTPYQVNIMNVSGLK